MKECMQCVVQNIFLSKKKIRFHILKIFESIDTKLNFDKNERVDE